MKVVIVEPEKAPYEAELPDTLEAMQDVVGGHIEIAYPFSDRACIVCNETGLLDGLPLNRAVNAETIIAGTFFVCGLGEEDLKSLSKEQVQTYLKRFRYPEVFLESPLGGIVPVKIKRIEGRPNDKEHHKKGPSQER